jgi:hypothetical protein
MRGDEAAAKHSWLFPPKPLHLSRFRAVLAAIGLPINEEFMLFFPSRREIVCGGNAMVTENSVKLPAGRHALIVAQAPKNSPAFLPPGARLSPLRRLFCRNEVAIAHRCLAIHMYFAGPHSALEE